MKYPVDIPILELAILEMIRMNPKRSFEPTQVAQWLYPDAWEYFVDDVASEARLMSEAGKVLLSPCDDDLNPLNSTLFKISGKS
ncbi:hypothetical protein MM239_07595 [Belliella sp. DSM 111904]|uniref:Uncharacterized protein n=1 Tax=Belliella filtrata TaxID=2923435 RepID=A0ABS9UYL4_9BACT|nr:hypothetical protein [Belliella filtrata]MCH7409252.1 hypothetical protein [Belliella filtrata]